MTIRHASKDDCAAIAEIYNHAVCIPPPSGTTKPSIPTTVLPGLKPAAAGYPVLVSEENGVITGYSSFGDWRAFDGFRHTVEHSVYVHPDHQGKGWAAACWSP
jgi:phosphinothricin acetyltransferase